jgi:hypothetical protein
MQASATANFTSYVVTPAGRHRLAVWLLIGFYTVVLGWTIVHGFSYYRLPLEERAYHPLNRELRPSGRVGITLALIGVASFLGIFLYAIRKRWKPLGKIGKTKNWLDLHVVMGISAPILITFHAGFKMRNLAGTSYWIMMAVMLSGIVGRYLYAQIPRRINAAELSLNEMQGLTDELTEQLQKQSLVSVEELKPLLAVPAKERVEAMPVALALVLMMSCDVKRPFLVARVRRRALSGAQMILTLGGLRPSPEAGLEKVIDLARRRSWIATKISFLAKTHQVFHLWHVVHRPFSYSFAILVCIHVTVAVLMGYF